jgi:hypothetical protein
MKVYIAGPYTKGDVAQNVKNALRLGDYLANIGHVPYVPHLTHFWHLCFPREYQWWLKYDLVWLNHCDCLVRIAGESSGADKEVSHAQNHKIPVFILESFDGMKLNDLDEWLATIEEGERSLC